MDATCTIQDSIHVFNLVHKYVSRILGTYQKRSRNRTIIPHRKRPCRISPLSGENLLYNMQKPHIIITKYANKDLRDENNCVAI